MLIAWYKRNGSDLETLSIVFDATNSENKNWFSKSRIIHSPWTDLESEPLNVFSIEGCCGGRDFSFPEIMAAAQAMQDGWPLSLLTVHGNDGFLFSLLCAVTGQHTQIGLRTVTLAKGQLRSSIECCKITPIGLLKHLAIRFVPKTRASFSPNPV